MLQYILECIAFQLVFLIIYDLFLKRETFFQWNRLYLIATYMISMVLPWIKIEAMKTTVPESFQAYPEFLWNSNDAVITATVIEETSFNISWEYALLFGGMLLATVFFGYKLFQIFTLKQKGEVRYFKDFTRIIVANSSIAFSFFKSIFLGDKVIAKDHQRIVEHELVHIRQRHSYDLLFFELMRIVGWFNPLVYVYQRRVSELHEFIADAHVAKTNKKEQYQLLLSEVFQTQHISFINQFFKSSLIKKRIVMLQKTQSKKIWQLKYLLLVPMVLGMLAYTSIEQESIELVESEQIQTKDDEKLITKVKKDIENEIKKFIESDKALFKDNRYGNLEKRAKAIVYMKLASREGDKPDIILSKKQYFKNEILRKMFFESIKPVEFGDDVLPRKAFPKLPLPSSSRYESYVSRKEAFYILDPNLQFSIKAYDQQVGLIDTKPYYSNSSFLFEVENVKDLTGEELRKFNNSLEKISENKSTYNALILTDGVYTFRVYAGLPQINRDNLATSNFKGYVERSNSKITLNVQNLKSLTQGEKAQQEELWNELRNSKNIDTLVVTDGKYSTKTVSNGNDDFIIKTGTPSDPIPFAVVDEVPIFPGCEDAENKRKCFNKNMQRHISKNFNYPEEAQEKRIQGRVNTIFIINKNGKIEGLRMRGPDSLLEKEVARIIRKLPKMKAGRHKGKRVDVPFSIPIEFKLKDDEGDLFEKHLGNKKQLNLQEGDLIKKYNQLAEERKRLLKSSNEKNPIIVNLEEQLKALKQSIAASKKSKNRAFVNKEVEEIPQSASNQYNKLVEERKRLLKKSNEKNPIIINLDAQIKALKIIIDQESETVPFATVDKVPVFPGCEDAEDKRKCFNEQMHKHISKNFKYPKEAQEKGVQGRVSILLTINTEGNVVNMRKRGPDKLLEAEAERIMKRLPKMTPGMDKGKAVNVPYSIPITFKLKEEVKFPLKLGLDGPVNNAPLIIIDGKESFNMKLYELEPDEIESMNIFKNEAAARIYGDKGKNGVIVIVTKKY